MLDDIMRFFFKDKPDEKVIDSKDCFAGTEFITKTLKELEQCLEMMERTDLESEALFHISQAIELLEDKTIFYMVDDNVIYVDWRK